MGGKGRKQLRGTTAALARAQPRGSPPCGRSALAGWVGRNNPRAVSGFVASARCGEVVAKGWGQPHPSPTTLSEMSYGLPKGSPRLSMVRQRPLLPEAPLVTAPRPVGSWPRGHAFCLHCPERLSTGALCGAHTSLTGSPWWETLLGAFGP